MTQSVPAGALGAGSPRTDHSAFSPVFTALNAGLHVLFAALALVVVVRAVLVPGPYSVVSIVLTAVMLGTYLLGAVFGSRARMRRVSADERGDVVGAGVGAAAAAAASAASAPAARPARLIIGVWLAVLSIEWIALVFVSPDAAYLVFPLFFLYLHLLRWRLAVVAVLASTAAAIIAIGAHSGFSLGGVVGPIVGAAVAVAIGLGYQALAREAEAREQLIVELVATREQLAATEREAGKLAERERLARDIHDTVAQALSSIQLLLHAAERDAEIDPPRSADHLRSARAAAATALTETRGLIDELSPPALAGSTIADALSRLAATTTAQGGPVVSFTVTGDPIDLSTSVQTCLLRVAQSAVSNAIRHAEASRADITLSYLDSEVILDVDDDGIGFEPSIVGGAGDRMAGGSFGLVAMRQRIEELGGSLDLRSAPGTGTTVTARFEEDA
ncbi:sensor histidine kinase [Plantibacter sp. YIM 135347]|uniref:sensor histidine kinase n=1 Tax=Plantibacter sp. YIM 135347 TaxID=3423919 RepID=UPI003D3438B2